MADCYGYRDCFLPYDRRRLELPEPDILEELWHRWAKKLVSGMFF